MNASDWIAIVQTVILLAGFALTVWQLRNTRKKKVDRIVDKLMEAIQSTDKGVYVAGLSEIHTKQLRKKLSDIVDKVL